MKILIAEDDVISRRVLEATLKKWGYEVIVAENGVDALAVLQSVDPPPFAILDWVMPGKDGVEVCRKVRQTPSETPAYIILLTAKNQTEDIVAGLEAGADDYLTKPFERMELRARIEVGVRVVTLQNKLASRVKELNQTLENLKEAETKLRQLSMTDELTGLYNRRGFLLLSGQQQKVVKRTKNPFSLIYADMDGLKHINDTYGHQEGSKAIQQVANILKKSFRESDIIGRFGGDEFTIFVSDTIACNIKMPLARLRENLHQYNAQNYYPYQLSLSIGTVCVKPEDDSTIEELLIKADEAMYVNKRQKKKKANYLKQSAT